ncbi:uncharacterized protein BYT42DRAFT_543854 [Radiomyces spectabilis]|uniref:uncharacterized protein n=1 Tax=Radiomyces spectabilis TaxID=64574 RepID=UPI00222009A6|nr:uncharacterized protein BYT42DRAFT_543854 [Radiomyces spectabilis]KAI8388581.1 hypothetical protein BYT42DRAFT_543854 [Radiomyces spectabilis]
MNFNQDNATRPSSLLQQQSTLSAYAKILDDSPGDSPKRQWSIRQANSRLHSHGLESALRSDLDLQMQEKNHPIPLHDLHRSSSHRHSNNPYLSQPDLEPPNRTPTYRRLHHKTYGYQDPFAVAPMEAWQEIKDYNLRVNGLPTLDQMIRLNTLSPLTQSNFATFLRHRGAQQNLNFLMEVETHEKLWQAFQNALQRRQTTSGSERLSQFLASVEKTEELPRSPTQHTMYFETPDTDSLMMQPPLTPRHMELTYASRTPGKSLSRHDLVQNATRIYRTFCSALDAAQPIHLPNDHRAALDDLIEKHQRPEPIVFDSARSHVFEILNVFYYPQFVDRILYTNIVSTTAKLLMIIALLMLVLGFALELGLIFTASGTMATRWWGLLPFLIGWSTLITSITEFAWWLAFTTKSEVSFLIFVQVQDKTVQRIHKRRGILWLLAGLFIAFVTTLIFVFIPSHRLHAP